MIRATIVTTPDCHLCDRAKDVLRKAIPESELSLEELDWDSACGRALIEREGVPFPPAVFLDGRLIGYGRLSEGALRKRLELVR